MERIIFPFELDGSIKAMRENEDGTGSLVVWDGKAWVDDPKGRLTDGFEEDARPLSKSEAVKLGAVARGAR
jgi:hypothetical protein